VKPSKPTSLKNSRPKLARVSEEMKAWSVALSSEVADWPRVARRSFFGFTALYRRDKIFALLPRTRDMETPNSLAFKLEAPPAQMLARLQRDPRVGSAEMRKTRWFTFEMASGADLPGALDWLGRAYDAAGEETKKYRG
jgi:hypothetical protein